jgi:hypothetical protein
MEHDVQALDFLFGGPDLASSPQDEPEIDHVRRIMYGVVDSVIQSLRYETAVVFIAQNDGGATIVTCLNRVDYTKSVFNVSGDSAQVQEHDVTIFPLRRPLTRVPITAVTGYETGPQGSRDHIGKTMIISQQRNTY